MLTDRCLYIAAIDLYTYTCAAEADGELRSTKNRSNADQETDQ
jgi:hypothetical protein